MNAIGQPISRVDGPDKVTGRAKYAAEFRPAGLLYAAIAEATIPSGRTTSIDTARAERAPGVVLVLTHRNAGKLPYQPMSHRPQVDPQSGDQLRVLQDDEVKFSGHPIALVVADTQARAEWGASLIRVTYERGDAPTGFDLQRARPVSEEVAKMGRSGNQERGQPEQALQSAPVRVDQRYVQPREHHNAMEPHATIAAWRDGRLTLWDKTQWVNNDRDEIAAIFGLNPDQIRVINPYVGGAFGSALRTWPHVTLAALAARYVGRPARLELGRRQLYHSIGFRPHTEQRTQLGASQDGKLTALVQEAWGQISSYEEYAENTLEPPAVTYACANMRTAYRLVRMQTNSPCPMRGPGEATGLIAQEAAMDELAAAAGIDPVDLRLRNFAEQDQKKGKPWSSNALRDCYRIGAERFGWSSRDPQPGRMRAEGQYVGFGMATAVYPGHRAKASVRVELFANGSAVIRSAASDMGPGTYTSMTQVAADALGLPVDRVRFELGDTDMPPAPVHGGSITMASVGSAVHAACTKLRGELGGTDADPAATLRARGLDRLATEGDAAPGEEEETHSTFAFGAVFVEVRVDPDFATVRVPRIVGAYDIGRVVNPRLARSQCIGGMVGGLGMALLEEAEWDERLGRVMNANLAEYLVPVNADVQQLDCVFVGGSDTIFNPLGVKGVAELGICGVAPAIMNAVWHATGTRVRQLPITPDRMIAAWGPQRA